MTQVDKPFAIVNGIKTEHAAIAVCELWYYDVWGNARDGFEVNDRSRHPRDLQLVATMHVSNAPSCPGASDNWRTIPRSNSCELKSVFTFEISDTDIAHAIGARLKQLEIESDGLTYEISQRSNSRPIGQLIIVGWLPKDHDDDCKPFPSAY